VFGGREGESDYGVYGYVEPKGNSQLFSARLVYAAYLVVGYGNQPIKTIAINVTTGKETDVGVVGLTGLCPKQ
jgi:hypothetical protein